MTPATNQTLQEEEILSGFQGTIARPQVPWPYRIGMGFAAFVLILLPLIYCAIAVTAGWVVAAWAYWGIGVLMLAGNVFGVIAYLTPIVAGSVIVFFLVKPLFARQPRGPQPLSLSREEEPTLHAFVDRICEIVGSPRPREIHVDNQVNASASFRRGLLSFLADDLVLTIGLPLAAGLRADQLAGVLAHEFGHFSQGAGMRLTYVVRSINNWFHLVVYRRDEWDAKLERGSKESDWRIAVMLWVARFGVWISRKILSVLMWLGQAASSFLMRQMEYDADLYGCRVAGSKAFEQISLELDLLNISSQTASDRINQLWHDGRLVDDFPKMVVGARRELPQQLVESVRAELEQGKTGRFDTHPATRDRLAAIRREDSLGVFRSTAPGASIFSDFEAVSKRVTVRRYGDLGFSAEDGVLLTAEDVALRLQSEGESLQALDEFGSEFMRLSHPLRLGQFRGASPSEALASGKAARDQVAQNAEEWRHNLELFDAARERRSLVYQADGLIRAGIRIRPKDFGVAASSHEAVDAALKEAESAARTAEEAPEAPRIAIESRLTAAQELVHARGSEESRERWGKLCTALNALADAAICNGCMEPERHGLNAILRVETDLEHPDLASAFENMSIGALAQLKSMRRVLKGVPYPFTHAAGDISLEDFVLPADVTHAAILAETASQRILAAYRRVLSELCLLALTAEHEANEKAAPAGEPLN